MAVALPAIAVPASAHTGLESSIPAQGATLATAPERIELAFGDGVTLPADPIAVTGPDGTNWGVGPATVAGAKVTVPVRPAGPAGEHTIAWQVISADGDRVRGTIRFTLSTPASTPASSAAPTTAPTDTTTTTAVSGPTTASSTAGAARADTGGDGFPVWAWIVIGVVILAGIGASLTVRSRRDTPPGDS